MTTFVALLRAVNVGGTGKLPMADLRALCADAGFADVRTYIASGNVVFSWPRTAREAHAALSAKLTTYAGKPVAVLIRTASEMAATLAANPFADAPGNKVVAIFLDHTPTAADITTARHVKDEEIALGPDALFVHYPSGQGTSKLAIPAAANGTARNMNTLAKLVAMTKETP